jgi:anti-sigma factor RsiW
MAKCDRVLQELSSYIDDDIDTGLRAAIEDHVSGCRRCTVLVDSTRKMLYVVGDERIFEVLAGFSERLHSRLAQQPGEPQNVVVVPPEYVREESLSFGFTPG